MINDTLFQSEMNKLMDRFACKLKPDQINQYWESLRNLDPKAFRSAVSTLLADDNVSRFPLPISIERLANKLTSTSSEDQSHSEEYMKNRIEMLERYRKKYQDLYDQQFLQYGQATGHVESKLKWLSDELYKLKPYNSNNPNHLDH